MKKKNIKLTILILTIIGVMFFCTSIVQEQQLFIVTNKNYKENTQILEQLPGTYTSTDGKTITVAENGTTKYLDAYALTVTQATTGNILSGKVGTSKTTATFYQLNDRTILSSKYTSYKQNTDTMYLYDYTVFNITKTVSPDQTGNFELWRNDSKVNTYKTLQDAVDEATTGDTIKITKNLIVTEGVYINKNITIDGQEHTLDKSKWANPVFVVEEGITSYIKNLTIDGGANNFEVDFSLANPAIKSGTLEKDPLSNISAVISKGDITLDKVNFNNHYTKSIGSALNIARGNANISNSTFNHNKATAEGAAIYIGSQPRQGELTYSVKKVVITNSELNYNMVTTSGSVSGGAAISVNWTESTDISKCIFKYNLVDGGGSGGGPAIFTNRNTLSFVDANNLKYPKLSIDESVFEKNYVGNDGSAIENETSELYVNNSKFIGNVGLSSSSSVGTISIQIKGKKYTNNVIENTIFEENEKSIIGDHATPVNLKLNNVTFKNNECLSSCILLYSANADFENVVFENNEAASTIINLISYVDTSDGRITPPVVTVDNVTFLNSKAPVDILLRKASHNLNYLTETLEINGPVNGEIHVWDENKLNINHEFQGIVHLDRTVGINDIKIAQNVKANNQIIEHPNTYTFITHHPVSETNTDVIEFLYLDENKVYTEKEMFMLLNNAIEGYKTQWFANKNFSTDWNFTPTAHATIYGKLVEHTHVSDGTILVKDNIIYEQCECGYLFKKISIDKPKETTYSGETIVATINTELNENDYELKYYVKENDEWKEISEEPKAVGEYKVVVRFNDFEISEEYSINEEVIQEEVPENPHTSNGFITIMTISLTIITLIILVLIYNKKKITKYTI